MRRACLFAVLFAGAAFAQLPRNFYAWWSSPVVKDLNLSDLQKRHIRSTITDYRGRLTELRGNLEKAENDLEFQFNQEPVDMMKASDVIDRLANARRELTRTLSEMSLRLRTILSEDQWRELQKRRPVRGQPQPAEPGEQRQ